MPGTRWSDEILGRMRSQGDPEAEAALRFLLDRGHGRQALLRRLFAEMDSNDHRPLHDHFGELTDFFESTRTLPRGIDLERVARGEDVFNRHAFNGALCLLCKSLPEGYQAPNLSIILNISGNLARYTYRRLLSTLQTVVNVAGMRGFQDEGRAIITAQKLRLLHAGVRHIARDHPELTARRRPGDDAPVGFEERYGVPASQEDMLGTILGFSLLVIEGWRTMGLGISPAEEEDYLYLWLCFARMMGIHPPGEPDSLEYIPRDVADAEAFYAKYEKRHYLGREENPDGVTLATANLKMLEDLARTDIPFGLYRWGIRLLPRLTMQKLMGTKQCRNLGLPTVVGHRVLWWILQAIHGLIDSVEVPADRAGNRVGLILFQKLIQDGEGSTVTFTVPLELEDLKRLAFEPGLSRDSETRQAISRGEA